jgi:hypothetical protein
MQGSVLRVEGLRLVVDGVDGAWLGVHGFECLGVVWGLCCRDLHTSSAHRSVTPSTSCNNGPSTVVTMDPQPLTLNPQPSMQISRNDIVSNLSAFNFKVLDDVALYEKLLKEGFNVISQALSEVDQVPLTPEPRRPTPKPKR